MTGNALGHPLLAALALTGGKFKVFLYVRSLYWHYAYPLPIDTDDLPGS